ncbi:MULTISPECIES: hypothetical protein [unclassified Streptomyces]|uniref:hypothetical protein n=1 Tax=unclassified Streptomyces TaxID=2593676 RepID=UPI0034370D03
MGYQDGVEPGLRTTLKHRKISLHERADSEGFVYVHWDGDPKYGPGDGLPIGVLYGMNFSFGGGSWEVLVNQPYQHVVGKGLPDINEAIRTLLLHLSDDYS